jgi:hypothetical protein
MRFTPRVQRDAQRQQAPTHVAVAHQPVAHQWARACEHRLRHPMPLHAAKAFG